MFPVPRYDPNQQQRSNQPTPKKKKKKNKPKSSSPHAATKRASSSTSSPSSSSSSHAPQKLLKRTRLETTKTRHHPNWDDDNDEHDDPFLATTASENDVTNNPPQRPRASSGDFENSIKDLEPVVENLLHEDELQEEEEEETGESERGPSFTRPRQHKNAPTTTTVKSTNRFLVEPSASELESARHISQLPLQDVARAWNLAPFLVQNLLRDGFEHFFPIQALSIPDVIASERHFHVRAQDICIGAPTGSGKTLSYVLPILNALAGRLVRRLTALVILPSRDLALQVYKVLERYVEHSDLRVGMAIGQSDFQTEQLAMMLENPSESIPGWKSNPTTLQRQLEMDPSNLNLALDCHGTSKTTGNDSTSAIDVLVCTPGRLIDHLDRTPGFTLQHLKFLVVDEADRLLSERYQNWIDRVLNDVHQSQQSQPWGQNTNANVNPSSWDFQATTWRRRDTKESSNELLSAAAAVRRPVQLRKFLVSATMTRDPQKLASLRLVNPKFFNVHWLASSSSSSLDPSMGDSEKFRLPESLQEFTLECTAEQKPLVLCSTILEHLKGGTGGGVVVVFTASVESTHRLARLLQLLWQLGEFGEQGQVVEFSSALSQTQRTDLVERCGRSNGGLSVVVCSDSMSRGIDIEAVSLVVNYDVPYYAKTYVHRCGRTARAGKDGKAVSILKKNQAVSYRKMRHAVHSPERVQNMEVDKAIARTVVKVYRSSLALLREVLEAEENGELANTQAIPDDVIQATDQD